MSYTQRIENLQQLHKSLDKQINDMQQKHPHVDEVNLAEMKKKKLQLKDEISRLTKLQWDEDTQRIGHGDE